MKRTYEQINEKIRSGEVVVVTASEIVEIVENEGLEAAFDKVDVVTTATFGPMCSSGAFLNFGHTDPPTRMEDISLNDVACNGGLAAVDTFIGATEESRDKGYEYGGAHVISDLIKGKTVNLKASGKGTDCYPNRKVEAALRLEDLNEAYLYNPRNCYQNYNAAINTSERNLFTYMGMLKKDKGNIHYATAGELSPLLNDPYYRTIGVGTRIFFGGAVGYVTWKGTQFNSSAAREENGIPTGTGGTLALIGDMKEMNERYIRPAVFEGYGTSLNVGVGIPIPVLDLEILKHLSISNRDIYQNVVDYSVESRNRPVLKRVSYEALASGTVEIDGKKIKTASTTSLKKSIEIANILKEKIQEGQFFLQEPVQLFDLQSKTNPFKE